MNINRPSKENYYMGIAREVARRSTCYRRFGGAIIVKGDQIISTGYIGAPRKTKDCFEHKNCLRDKLKIPHGERYEICRSVHSEQNAIINAARAGANLYGGTMYSYMEDPKTGEIHESFPCFICKKMLINAGIKEVITCSRKNKLNHYDVDNWAKEWQKIDILDSQIQYGRKENGKQIKKNKKIISKKRK